MKTGVFEQMQKWLKEMKTGVFEQMQKWLKEMKRVYFIRLWEIDSYG